MNKPSKVSKPPKKSPSKPAPKADEQHMLLASISKKKATAILLVKKFKLEKEIAAHRQKELERTHKMAPGHIKHLEATIARIQLEIKAWRAFHKSPSLKTCPDTLCISSDLVRRLSRVNAQLASLKLIEGENILLTVAVLQALFDDE